MTPPLPTELNRGAVSFTERGARDMSDSSSWAGRPRSSDRLKHPPLEPTRKRLSFFGRTSSDNRAIPPVQDTHHLDRSHSRPYAATQSLYDRPSTGISHLRRKADPIEAIRNTLFGFRNRRRAARGETPESPRSGALPPSSSPPPPPSRQQTDSAVARNEPADTSLIPFAAPLTSDSKSSQSKDTDFKTEDEFYQHRKKRSISRPFNFQHVTHTASKHLPQLNSVDERDLPGKFWAVNAYQKPKDGLKEIAAEDLLEPIATQADELPPSSPIEQDETSDETTFDETQETKFDPDAFETMHEVRPDGWHSSKTPKHYSSMSALKSPTQNDPDDLRHVIVEEGADEGTPPRRPHRAITSPAIPSVRASMPAKPAPPPESLILTIKENPKSSTPSPRRHSKTSLRSSKNLGQLFPAPPKSDYAGSVHSKRSSRSNATNATRASRKTDLPVATWEDVVDFAFEQEAEATCNFDWENVSTLEGDVASQATSGQTSPEDESPPGCSGGVLLSSWLDGSAVHKSGPSTEKVNLSSASTDALSSSSDILSPPKHKRGTSVGHRGFQAARSRSASTDAILEEIPQIEIVESSSSGHSLSIPNEDTLKQFLNAAECEKSPYTTGEMRLPTLYSRGLFTEESLSDPEGGSSTRSSPRRSIQHRRRSSDTVSLQASTASDITRWSSASTSSLPDLTHGRRARSEKRKSRQVPGRVLASLPQSLAAEDATRLEPLAIEAADPSPEDESPSEDHDDRNTTTTSDLLSDDLPSPAKLPLPPTPPLKLGPLPPLPVQASKISQPPTFPRRLRPVTTSAAKPTAPPSTLVPESRSRYRKTLAPRSKSYAAGELDAQKLSSQTLPARPSDSPELMMRRPETSGDRALLFSAGRAVQRGRSATPPSRVALGIVEGPELEQEDGGFF